MKTVVDKKLYINVVKGVAIFLMVWGHCIQYCALDSFDYFDNWMFKIIYSFHMPLFMMVSGYLFYYSFQKRDLKGLIVHRAKPLIQSIVVGNIIIYFATVVVFSIFRGEFGVTILSGWINSFSGLWFLWSVLSASTIVAVIAKKISQPIIQILLLFCAIIIVFLFPNGTLNAYVYPYYIIGFLFAKYKDKINKWILNLRYISLLLFPMSLFFFHKEHYIYTSGLLGNGYTQSIWGIIKIDAIRWAVGFIGCIFALTVIYGLVALVEKSSGSRLKKILLRPMEKAGESSLQIYVLSVIFVSAYLPMGYRFLIDLCGIGNFIANNIWIYNLLFTFLLAVICTIGLFWINKALYKIKVGKWIFSK